MMNTNTIAIIHATGGCFLNRITRPGIAISSTGHQKNSPRYSPHSNPATASGSGRLNPNALPDVISGNAGFEP